MKQIMWEKYESMLDRHFNSQLIEMVEKSRGLEIEEEFDEYDDEEQLVTALINVPTDLSYSISLSESYDCWVGYTNFEITPPVMATIAKVTGIEFARPGGRYRFMIGLGKLFSFTDVRKEINDKLKTNEKSVSKD